MRPVPRQQRVLIFFAVESVEVCVHFPTLLELLLHLLQQCLLLFLLLFYLSFSLWFRNSHFPLPPSSPEQRRVQLERRKRKRNEWYWERQEQNPQNHQKENWNQKNEDARQGEEEPNSKRKNWRRGSL